MSLYQFAKYFFFLLMFNFKKDKLTPNQILLKNRVLAATIPLRNLEDFGRVKRYASDPWKDEIQRQITRCSI